MKIYVAGKWEDKSTVQKVQRLLRSVGHRITFDWTTVEDENLSVQAMHDMQGVLKADALVFVAYEDYGFRGAYVELGMALMKGISVYVLGTGIDKCIFTHLPQVHQGIEDLLWGHHRESGDSSINTQQPVLDVLHG